MFVMNFTILFTGNLNVTIGNNKWFYCVQYHNNIFVSLNTDQMNPKKVYNFKNHMRAGLNHAKTIFIA